MIIRVVRVENLECHAKLTLSMRLDALGNAHVVSLLNPVVAASYEEGGKQEVSSCVIVESF